MREKITVLNNRRGLSTIELIVVISLFSVISMSVIPLFLKAIATNKESRDKLTAYQAAHTELEKVRSEDFDTLADYPFTVTGLGNGFGNMVISDEIDGIVRTDIVSAKAVVTWQSKSVSKSVTLMTFVSKKGINQ